MIGRQSAEWVEDRAHKWPDIARLPSAVLDEAIVGMVHRQPFGPAFIYASHHLFGRMTRACAAAMREYLHTPNLSPPVLMRMPDAGPLVSPPADVEWVTVEGELWTGNFSGNDNHTITHLTAVDSVLSVTVERLRDGWQMLAWMDWWLDMDRRKAQGIPFMGAITKEAP